MNETSLAEKSANVVQNANLLKQFVKDIIGDSTVQLDECFQFISQKLSSDKELTDGELDRILLRLPLYADGLSVYIQELEVMYGIADATQTEDEAKATINSVGTVVEKKAKSDLAGIDSGLIATAYKSALTLLKSKVAAAYELLASAKKVHTRRLEEFRNVSLSKGVE